MTFALPPRFRIVERLGRGGFGEVYVARDEVRGVDVALKRLARRTPDALARFKNEFRAVQEMRHVRLVALQELFEHEGEWFFTMELVRGVDFFRATRRFSMSSPSDEATVDMTIEDAVDGERLRALLTQLVDGVAALHAAGHLHRDLKPSNVIVDAAGALKILDFGLVTELEAGHAGRSLELVGTPAYASPEQLTGQEVTPASDWYAVGAMIHEALAGRPPFDDVATGALLFTKMSSAPPLPKVAAGLDDLAALSRALLQADPARRPGLEALRARLAAVRAPVDADLDESFRDDADEPTQAEMGGSVAVLDQSARKSRPTHVLPFATPPAVTAGRVADATQSRVETFLGRARELEALLNAQRATANGGAIACVIAPSGMGKSALLRAFGARVRGEDRYALVLNGRCFETESVPFKAVDGVVEDLTRAMRRMSDGECRELLPNALPALVELFPTLGRVEAVRTTRRRGAPAADPVERRRQGMQALRELLERAALRRAVVLCIDDAQWGDADSAVLLEEIVRAPTPPLLVVVATRERRGVFMEAAEPLQAGLAQAVRPALTIELGPLDASAAAALAIAMGADEERAALVAREAAGHPLFVEELTRGATGAVDLASVIRARSAALPDVARRVLQLVAVAGVPVEIDLLDAVTADRGQTWGAVEHLRAARLVRTAMHERLAAEGTTPALAAVEVTTLATVEVATVEVATVEAYHDRVREAVAGALTADERTRLHRVLAESLLLRRPDDDERIAAHLEAAADPRAAAALARAAARAARMLTFERAASLAARALTADASAPVGERRALLLLRADALEQAGRGPEAAKVFDDAAELSPPAEALDLRRRAARAMLQAGYVEEGAARMKGVVAAAGYRWPSPRVAAARGIAALLRWRLFGFSLPPPGTRAPAEVAARLRVFATASTSIGAIDPRLAAGFVAGHGRLLAKHPDSEEALIHFVALANIEAALVNAPRAERALGQIAAALGDAADLARLGEHPTAGPYHAMRAVAPFLYGNPRLARERLAEVVAALANAEPAWSFDSTVARASYVWTLYTVGDYATLRSFVPPLAREAERRGNRFALMCFATSFGVAAWLAADDVGTARAVLERAASQWRAPDFGLPSYWLLLGQCIVDLYDGKAAAAMARLRTEWPRLKGSDLMRIYFIVALQMWHLRASCALELGDLDDARRCIARLRKVRSPLAHPLADLLDAAALHQRGDAARAHALLTSSAAALDAHGLGGFADGARCQAASRSGGAPAGDPLAPLRARGLERPERWLVLTAPGFGPLPSLP